MAVADTARLLASYELQDKSAAGVRSALGGVNRLQAGVGSLGTRLSGFASNLKNNVGGALTTFGGRIRQVGLGLAAGLGIGGLLSLGGALRSGIDRAREFGDEVIRISKLTGLSVETTSALAAAMEHFGVSSDTAIRLTGMLEKNLGNITLTTKKAQAFQKSYGLALEDASGHVKDANTLLLDSADFFNNKSIPAQTKAAALTKLYGRSWQDLVPLLSAGKKGIQAAEEEAAKFGLILTKDNIDALKKSKDVTRDWNTALGGLELQIGLKLLPKLTDLAKTATTFVAEHGKDIIKFFDDVATFAGNAAATIGGFVSKVGEFWNKIPGPLRDLLIKGIVADRTVKFLFGISPIKLAVSLAADALGGIAKGIGQAVAGSVLAAGIGKAFVQPVFVTNPGFGVPGGGGVPGVVPAAGGLGLVTGGLALIGVAGIELLIADAIGKGLRTLVTGSDKPLTQDHVVATLGPVEIGLFRSLADELRPHPAQSLTNQSGSPDDRQARHDTAVQIAKEQDAHFNRLNTKIEDSGTTTKTGLNATRTALDTIRSKIAVDDSATLSATRTGTSQIVDAIDRNKPVINVTVNVAKDGSTDTIITSGGHTGGGGRKP